MTDQTCYKPLPAFLQTSLTPGLPPAARAEPLGLFDHHELRIVPAEIDDLHIDMLSQMVSAGEGSTFSLFDLERMSHEAMCRLVSMRAVCQVVDEFQEIRYKANLSCVLPALRSTVVTAELDLHVTRSSLETGQFQDVSKIELLYHLLEAGFRPVTLTGRPLRPDQERILYIQNLQRSKKYFEALAQLDNIFARGISNVSHQVMHLKTSRSSKFV